MPGSKPATNWSNSERRLLIGILLAAGNRSTAKAWARWEREHALRIRLAFGMIMVALGVIMLFWII